MQIALLLLLAYLLGAIPTGLIVGKLFFNKDIRKFGSGNLGATNTFRVLGKKAGIFVTIFDVAKGVLPAIFPIIYDLDIHGIWFGLAAIIGHVYPIYLKFKGGKAVATSAGVILGVNPVVFLIIAVIFFTLLFTTRMVSLTSILTSIGNFITTLFFDDIILQIISFLIMLLIIIRHSSNIKRIISGTEPKIQFKK
ncbi:glycerol-3-phosphate 1-O-acyltransferase PlsY [Macrococcoides caseolyticum]|uniref:glycerol-3-phosphate 1-O-acyltransferase PlsY n=1 Tax=Macrococcoides caseolyticum TaxID=69966 RepID=UPI000C151012|nr:glycerol-3-phosphate 1-O-acyltransferase PlsY [Macrococcus caseolyticus]MDJ1153773.1 glycerol-3-phosphate 1-O-acyltransferase PlsY [Macrococcus caseolyticus]PKE12201.1 acyl-phosphate glycerol 3-phosphate acyltransferase [Macrococcus caseolyticus]PKE48674.1 acyl-phosphate glycerol 3-phosphate acyltransferase [Macrococcus caseolyticus]PKF15725.1 acyl-phosphate glycerol 3-phosphate acyltransferase [Macrococcus caseolyticus]PNZ73819.1 acyl-phosphate glycerol 3-phosphate acyltransferase [Macroco